MGNRSFERIVGRSTGRSGIRPDFRVLRRPAEGGHGGTGLVVARRDPAALADAVAGLAGDSGRRATMGAAGRAGVERLFRLDRQLDAWERFYDDVLDRRASRAATPLVRG